MHNKLLRFGPSGIPTLKIIVCTAFFAWSPSIHADVTVREYVVRVQEERRSTRWTLTEWLRIKERMKMMDLWLAVFSDPKKDQILRPEINLGYMQLQGSLATREPGASPGAKGTTQAHQGHVQLWLTNLISSTTGIRTLNIDIGLEGLYRDTRVAPEQGAHMFNPHYFSHMWYSGNLRLFGDSVQDTSLVVRFGQYRQRHPYGKATFDPPADAKGLLIGIQLQAYVFSFLGLEGNYLNFGRWNRKGGETGSFGEGWDYGGFLEIGMLRLGGGAYGEVWRAPLDNQSGEREIITHGFFGALKVLL